ERVAFFTHLGIQYDHAVNGAYHNGTGLGKMTFLGGHSYSTSLPYSTNFEAPYLRFFFNALFVNGIGVPKLGLTTSPATVPQGGTPTVLINVVNAGSSTAMATQGVAVTLEPGVTFLATTFGPAPTSISPGPGGTTVVTWGTTLGD